VQHPDAKGRGRAIDAYLVPYCVQLVCVGIVSLGLDVAFKSN
jgi:hypothetical protein